MRTYTTSPIRTTHRRGPNALNAHPEIITGENPDRRAYGRNVKLPLPDRRYDAIRVYTLKQRIDGKWVTKSQVTDRTDAVTWVNGPK